MRLKDTPAYDYCRDFLKAVLDIEHLVVGHDFNFGKGRAGSPEQLVDIGKELGFIVERVPAYIVDDEPVSSSRIRKTIIAGDVALARRLLGSPFHLRGEVVVGDRRGKAKLGYPTANLSFQQELIPADGVYLACIEVSGERHPALANVGNNPTFHNNHRPSWVEAWIMDFSRDIYNEKITVHFIERLRGELTFDSEQELIQRIKMDEQQARLRCREEDPCAF